MAVVNYAARYRFLYNSLNGKTIKLAFYSSGITATTAAYTATNEVTDTGAGTPIPVGGVTLSNISYSNSDGSVETAYADWDNVTITPTQQVQFRYILVYNDTDSPKFAIFSHDFGSTQTWNAATAYTLTIPSTGSGLVRIGT